MNLPFDEWLPLQRWYAGRGRELRSAVPHAVVALDDDLDHVLLDVAYVDGSAERYQLLVRWRTGPSDEFSAAAAIGESASDDGVRIGYDALYDPGRYCRSSIGRQWSARCGSRRNPTPPSRCRPCRG